MSIHRSHSPIVALALALVTGAWVVANSSIAAAEVQWSPSIVAPLASEAQRPTPDTGEEHQSSPTPVDLVLAQLALALGGSLLVGVAAFAIVNRAHLKDAFRTHATGSSGSVP